MHGLQAAAQERLFAAYFSEGLPISDRATLVALARSVGLDEDEARAMLESDRFAAEVREDELTAARFGISGVPFFVLDRRLGLSGAQPVEVMLGALERPRPIANWPDLPTSTADGPAAAGTCLACRFASARAPDQGARRRLAERDITHGNLRCS